MKTKSQPKAFLLKMIVLVSVFILVIFLNRSMAEVISGSSHNGNRVAINFKNNAERNELRIRVKSGAATTLQLFIFSPDGILIKEVAVSAAKITTIKSLKKGFYIYECFDNDERMKSGKLFIK